MTNNAHAYSEVVCQDLEVVNGALKSYQKKREREVTAMWAWAGGYARHPELELVKHRWECVGHIDRTPGLSCRRMHHS